MYLIEDQSATEARVFLMTSDKRHQSASDIVHHAALLPVQQPQSPFPLFSTLGEGLGRCRPVDDAGCHRASHPLAASCPEAHVLPLPDLCTTELSTLENVILVSVPSPRWRRLFGIIARHQNRSIAMRLAVLVSANGHVEHRQAFSLMVRWGRLQSLPW